MGIISSRILKPEYRSQYNNQIPMQEKVVDSSSDWQNQHDVFMKGGGCKQQRSNEESHVKTFLSSTTVSLDEINEEEDQKFVEFMKGGGCKESFTAWNDDCNFTEEEAEKNKDLVTKCAGLFGTFSKCMDTHSDYYHPILAVKKTTEEHLEKELATFFLEES
ncbi:putative protein [Arabidopsis thaliana]|uniref:GCK domain-containing protein n=2 Tax=Arabidopsis TaxID=3701 RepID=Q9LZL1_ARATH|nr:GCK domain-containing protein [Arabidopsis thaliana]AED90445.1 GCK domain-containing protein [Arabidopsis thaliana]KAG7607821.1 GCK domain [Arabidopsis suecica]CAB82994.1 putative protein [Arabidopsis thaliana]|eukprot:NP_195841.1 GCK domain-containing protein [Arabidopsis thaliana]